VLLTRVLTALLGAPLLVALIVWGPAWGFPALTVVLVALALHELYTLTTPGTPPWLRGLGILVGSAIAASWLCCQGPQLALAVATLGTLALLLAHLRLAGELPAAAPRIAASLGGLAYGVLPLTHLGLLYQLPPGWKLVLLVLLFTFAGDTLAYFVGRAVGRRPFAPRVSPKKTWEGALGGLLGSTLACLAWRQWVMPELTLVDVLVLGLGVGFCGQLGDLCESLIKRSVGVKDSGKLLPGHGGVLDRFDAVSFSAPLVYYYYLAFVDAARPLQGWLQLKPF
jgi:phosphatidate cytidylyltransferase